MKYFGADEDGFYLAPSYLDAVDANNKYAAEIIVVAVEDCVDYYELEDRQQHFVSRTRTQAQKSEWLAIGS